MNATDSGIDRAPSLRSGCFLNLHLGFWWWVRVTPAMEAGLMDHVRSLEELVGLLEPTAAGAMA